MARCNDSRTRGWSRSHARTDGQRGGGVPQHQHHVLRCVVAHHPPGHDEFEGPDTVAAVFLEPVQNSGGCLTPPPGYFERVREICDRHDVLLVSDEVICAFGRHGTTFAGEKFGYTPDLITCAKGMSSGYGPIGAMIASEKVIEPFLRPGVTFPHGYTFAGHPVAAALSLANLDIMENERLNQVAPPLICGQAEFDEMEQILRHTLTEAQNLV
jgi:adenosylmethionine-8-amino-7-oxononanoate aminotransferase